VLDSLTTDALTPIVRRALENPFAVPTAWQWSPIAYKRYLSARTLARVDGTADTGRGGVLAPWSVVVKIFQPPTDCADSATEDGSWEREVLAYRSGLLADLPGALVAPRVLDIHTDDSGNRWLWLEHITDMYGVWPRQHYGVAARHLGYFNGTYMTSRQLPEYSWLDRDWAKSLSDPAVQVEAIDGLLSHPLAREAFDRPLAGRARALLEDQPHFLRILSELPQTLCHHDAARANVFAAWPTTMVWRQRQLPSIGRASAQAPWVLTSQRLYLEPCAGASFRVAKPQPSTNSLSRAIYTACGTQVGAVSISSTTWLHGSRGGSLVADDWSPANLHRRTGTRGNRKGVVQARCNAPRPVDSADVLHARLRRRSS